MRTIAAMLATAFSTGIILVGAGPTPAHGEDIAVPAIVFDPIDPAAVTRDDELDIGNIVQSAVKDVTTVQEAPAIVTVITAEDLRTRGYQDIAAVLDGVPGWHRFTGQADTTAHLTRGFTQSMLYMHDGMSLYDPFFNVPSLWRIQSMETIKRIEFVTGPGGVLWGANSFLGVMNVIGKGADDVDGVEAGVSFADGNGDPGALRGYAMAGVPKLLGEDSGLFLHASFETFRGPALELPALQFWAPPPQPNAPNFYGPLTRAAPRRSMAINLDGKLTRGGLSLSVQAPFAEQYGSTGFGYSVFRERWEEDSLRLPDGSLACPFEEPYLVSDDRCIDKGRTARDNQYAFFERYLLGEYRTRLAGGSAGLAFKGYGIQFVRDYPHLGGVSSVPALLDGGIAFGFDATSYRVGGGVDGDLELSKQLRLHYGAEAFRDWTPSDASRSRQGDGVEAVFVAPLELARLPLPCPREPDPDSQGVRIVPGCPLTFSFPADRAVIGAYLNPQWRPNRALIVDAGARLQAAPAAIGSQAYDLTPIFSSTLVYNFRPQWHLKLGYSQGFRPPIFEHTNSNGEAIQLDGDTDLAIETSDAIQGEVNARVFKGERRLRELSFRVDYSYSRIQNYIQLVAGRYENTAERGVHSVELLGKLHVQGGHRLELGYTFLRIDTADNGAHKSMPEHWFNLTSIFELVDERLTLSSNLRVVGALETPHLVVEYRDLRYDEAGAVVDASSGAPTSLVVDPHELVMDRMPPAAELSVGLTYRPTPRWQVSVATYNTLDARHYQPEPAASYEPRLKFVGKPYPDFSARLSVTYRY